MTNVLLPVRDRETEQPDSASYTFPGDEALDAQLSPELALVDPELAAAARLLLPDPVEPERPRPAAPVLRTEPARPLVLVEQIPAAAPRPPAKRTRLLTVAVAGATVAAGVLGLTLAVQHGTADGPRAGSDSSPTALQVRAARVYTWPAVPGAEAYVFEMFRGVDAIFKTTTSRADLELPDRVRLSPGRYRWFVTPVFPSRSGTSLGRSVVEATFVVSSS